MDAIIITGSSSSLVQNLITKLNQAFSFNHFGTLDYFLGIEVKHGPSNSLLLTQSKYIRDLLQRTNMLESNHVATPMQSTCKLTKTGLVAMTDPYLHRSVVGALQYATLTRSEIAYSVNKVCQFMAHP